MKYGFIFIIFFFSIISAFAEIVGNSSGRTSSSLVVWTWWIRESLSWITLWTSLPKYYRSLRSSFWLSSFYDDSNLLRFVSRYTPLNIREYIPPDLESISGANINEAGRTVYLRAEARDWLIPLAEAFTREFGEPLTVISGYRSAAYQQRMWDLGKCNSTLCAPPGYSEHQLGLAVDLFDATIEKEFDTNKRYVRYIQWLKENAYHFGWTQSYQKWVDIDMYEVEPWHWRYIGIPMATRLYNLRWTYTEFVRFQEAIQRR